MIRWWYFNVLDSCKLQLKSVATERFIRTLKVKIYKKTAINDSKSYLSYSNKLVDEYNNNTALLVKSLFMILSCFDLRNWIESWIPKFKVGDILQGKKIFLVKVISKIDQKKHLWLILCWKVILGYTKLKI